MARYRVAYRLKRTRDVERFTEPVTEHSTAEAEAIKLRAKCSVVTILRDSEGADHPDNAGKFFLDTIVK